MFNDLGENDEDKNHQIFLLSKCKLNRLKFKCNKFSISIFNVSKINIIIEVIYFVCE